MRPDSFQRRALWGAAVFAVALCVYAVMLRTYVARSTFLMTYVQSLSPLVYLGWLGLGELRRHGRFAQVRRLQFALAAVAIPLVLRPGTGLALVLVTLEATIMLLAFVWGMRLRRAPSHD